MTKLFKNSKQVLSFVLAFAVLAVSLFTGVVINSDAACDLGTVWYYDGTPASSIADTSAGTVDDPIIIASAAELAYLAKSVGTASNDLYYELDNVDTIIMQPQAIATADKDSNGVYDIMELEDWEATKNYFDNLEGAVSWVNNSSSTNRFGGKLDGKGVQIYGIYYKKASWTCTGLFPNTIGGVEIRNIAIRNSYFSCNNYAGALIGYLSSGSDTSKIENCEVSNCYVYNSNTQDNNGNPQYHNTRTGVIVGWATKAVQMNNILTYGSHATNANPDVDEKFGIFGNVENTNSASYSAYSFSNMIVLDAAPLVRAANACHYDRYTNVYTNDNLASAYHPVADYNDHIYIIEKESVIGAAGKEAMDLDWDNVWFANAGMPELRVFHNISDEATPTENGHTVKCEDCNLVSVEMAHIFKNNACVACGAALGCGARVVEIWGDTKSTLTGEATVHGASEPRWYNDTFELLDPSAENSETNPYIVDSAEGLAWLATKATAAETTGKWYKVADGIKAFNMNTVVDMSGDMTTAEVEAALNTTCQMKTWWGGNFAGSFDGNGVTIYGVQGYNTQHGGSGSLFGKVAAGATFKNFTLKNSYFKGDAAGSLFNNATGAGTITMEGIVLTGNVLVATRSNGAETYGGVLFARAVNNRVDVKNCLAYNNIAKHQGFYGEKTGYDVTYGFIGNAAKVNEVNSHVENTIILDCLPFTAQYSYSSSSQIVYSNVYTNMIDKEVANTMVEDGPYTTTFTGGVISKDDGKYNILVKLENRGNQGTVTDLSQTAEAGSFYPITFDGIKGAAAVELMSELDWADTWFAVEGDVPTLRAFHTGFAAANDNGDGTHSESCNCGLKGAAVPHEYEKATTGGKCKVCGAGCTHGGAVPPQGNWGSFVFSETVAGDCVTAAKGNMVCSLCGLTSPEMDDPSGVAGHKFKDVEAIPADCQGAGTIAHKLCTVCGNAFDKAAADDEPMENALESTVDPIKDHTAKKDSNGDIIYDMSEAGYHAKICSVCNTTFDKEAHVGDYTKDETGHTGTCTICKMPTSGKEPHNFGDDSVCDVCEYTCTHGGAVPPQGNWGTFVFTETVKGDCQTAAKGNMVCSLCGLTSPEMADPNFVATEHKWIDDGEAVELDYMSKTATACKKQAQKCEKCGIAGEDRIIGHTAGEWETQPYADSQPACSGDGYHTDVLSCTECFYQIDTKIVTDPEVGHNFEDVAEEAPTCSRTGTIAHKYCAACGGNYAVDAADDEPYENALTYDSMDIPVDPKAHVWVEYGKDASCTEDGVVAHKFCSDCYLLVVNDEETDVAFDGDEFYEYDEEYNPVGPGAIFESNSEKLTAEAFANFIAENYADYEFELPEFPEKPADDADDAAWNEYYAAMDAYYIASYEIEETLWVDTEGEWWDAWTEYNFAAYSQALLDVIHGYLLEKAEAADIDLVIPADPDAHTLVKVDEVAATYDKEGTKAHYACECGKLFADAEGKNEVTAESLVIAKLVKDEDKTSTDDKTDGDSSDKSPATGESVAAVAAVAALMGAAFVIVRKARKA